MEGVAKRPLCRTAKIAFAARADCASASGFGAVVWNLAVNSALALIEAAQGPLGRVYACGVLDPARGLPAR